MKRKPIEELEVKVAFLEDALSQLSDEHYQQQRELESLKKQFAQLSNKLTSGQDDENQAGSPADERPPHY